MKHYVSFETAKKLEAAGFERPKIEVGQYWYTDSGRTYIVCAIVGSETHVKWIGAAGYLDFVFKNTNDWIYAPTATDLLEQLPDEYILSKNGNEWFCGCLDIWPDGLDGYDPKFTNEDAAEAVAEAFLSQSQ